MHIGYWCPAWPLEKFQNGIITYVHWMKLELEARGHRVSIFTEGEEQTPSDPQVYYVRPRLKDRALRRLSRMWQPTEFNVFDYSAVIASGILRLHRRDPIDIIEMEESFGWSADIARRTSLPLLVKLHGPAFLTMPEEERKAFFGREKIKREGNALRAASAIISPSNWALTKTIKHYGLTPKETGQINNPIGVDTNMPLWSLETCELNTILYVGRFDMIKGADVLLQAFYLLLKRRPDARLIFIGPDFGVPGPDGRPIQFEAYCKLHFPADFRNSVDFRGRMPIREVAKLRTRAMVTVAASRSENQPYAVLEAMLQGCPVVTTDAGGCPEIVADGTTGLLAKSQDPEDFALRILAILEKPELSAAMGQAARRHVIEHYSPATVAGSSMKMYEKVIANSCR
jgi:glycosyltransferase involved in cell wall biosynthesis